VAAWIFGGILAGWAGLVLGSAALFADLGVLLDPQAPGSLHPTLRFDATLALILAYSSAAAYLGERFLAREFEALQPVVRVADAEWQSLRERLHRPGRADLLAGIGGGALFGLAVNGLSTWLGGSQIPRSWPGLAAWVWVLNPLLFAVLGVLAFRSASGGALFTELGRRSEVSLLDVRPLLPFARVGLRLAALWLVGSSLATLLFAGASEASVVAGVLVITVGIGLLSLLAPSRGIHERLREVKQAELAWLRAEIARAREALGGADGACVREAARLPALLAWEARVESVPEWPLDTSTFLRFVLFALVPLGSWLAAALVERAIDALLG
jgi:hypothetical protein